MKKQNFKNFPLIILGVCLVLASGCKKDVPVLTTTAVTEITNNTAISGGDITSEEGSAVTARGVCWSTGQTPTIADNKTTDGAGTGKFSSGLSGLYPYTTYYVRAYATNSAGTGYGNVISFTTKEGESFTDPRDGNVYKIVKIGNQVWMAENLRYLPSVVDPDQGSQTTPCYYVYDYYGTSVIAAKATSNYTTYGVLYNWSAACSSCPPGWHLPTYAEWEELIKYVGEVFYVGGKLKETDTTHWQSPNEGATNEVGFTALPGGYRNNDGAFYHIREYGCWWTDTWSAYNDVHYKYICSFFCSVHGCYISDREIGLSVRCVKD